VFGLGAPLWLAALAVLPVIRWLHRWQAPLIEVRTGGAFLWREASGPRPGAGAKRPPDPAWRLRALIAALVILALADPGWEQVGGRITVWIDDTLSMLAEEDGESRLAAGLERLADALDETPASAVTLRSLTDPALARDGGEPDSLQASTWQIGDAVQPSPPPAAIMKTDTVHWLVSDGADRRIADWAARAPISRSLLVGAAIENASVLRLAARRDPDEPTMARVLVVVANRGEQAQRRRLQLEADGNPVISHELEMAPGEARPLRIEIPVGARLLSARLGPGDALPADDRLTLDMTPLHALRARIDPGCPADLQRALTHHPGLVTRANGGPASLQVTCGKSAVPGTPGIVFHTGATEPVTAPLVRAAALAEIAEFQLQPDWLKAAAWPRDEASDGYETVLAAGERPLLRRGPGPLVETVIDMANPGLTGQPEYAALVGTLVDLALGRPVLDPVALAERPAAESDIAPLAMVSSPSAAVSARVRERRSLMPPMLAAALALLLFDGLRLHRSARETAGG